MLGAVVGVEAVVVARRVDVEPAVHVGGRRRGTLRGTVYALVGFYSDGIDRRPCHWLV